VVERKVTVQNKTGLHARPAAMFVQKASQFASEISVTKGEKEISAKSIMGVMALAISQGTEITIRAKGDDAQAAVDALVQLIEGFLD